MTPVGMIKAMFTGILVALRSRVSVTVEDRVRSYEQIYEIPETALRYITIVTESRYSILYNFWITHKVIKKIYKAELRKYDGNEVIDCYSDHYPPLTFNERGDPLYPLAMVAHAHLERYLSLGVNDVNSTA